jgi:hypothetical protein
MPIGVERGKLAVWDAGGPTPMFKIYAYGNAISTLIPGLLKRSALQYDLVGANRNVSAHRVTRYPGDPGYTRAAHQRKVHSNRGRSGSSTTPGKRFWIEEDIQTDSGIVTRSKQFTYTGSWPHLIGHYLQNGGSGDRIRRESSVSKDNVQIVPI